MDKLLKSKKIVAGTILITILSGLFYSPIALAQEVRKAEFVAPAATTNPPGTVTSDQVQTNRNNAANALAGDWASCSVGSVLGNIMASAVGNAFSEIGSMITGIAPVETPTKDVAQRIKNTGPTIPLTGIPIGASTDAIAWCFVNSIIRYLSDSVIMWIRSGFQGSPLFVDDPAGMFQSIADYEAATFLNELTDGAICSPWEIEVRLGLINGYANRAGYRNRRYCSLEQINNNLDSFLSGNMFDIDTFYNMTQFNENNPIGLGFELESDLMSRIASRQGATERELGWTQGWLNIRDSQTGKITTPGRVIQSHLESSMNLPKGRLALADEFDEVMTELINELVKVAVNELFEGTNGGF